MTTETRTAAVIEAIEVADANLNNVCLPTYSELEQANAKLRTALEQLETLSRQTLAGSYMNQIARAALAN